MQNGSRWITSATDPQKLMRGWLRSAAAKLPELSLPKQCQA
jgi:cell division inhibitor SulA